MRHVGEPIAVVVAESRYIAEDAAEQVVVDYEPLPARGGIGRCAHADAPLIHEDLDQNLNAHAIQTQGRLRSCASHRPMW